MKPTYLPLLTALLCTLALCGCSSDSDDENTPGERSPSSRNVNANPAIRPEYTRLEMPRVRNDNNNLVVVHSTAEYGVNYILEWDCQKKSQRWSCYTLDRRNSPKNVSRYYSDSNQYPKDPDIPSAYTFASDPFYRSGYDHGHICPSNDRRNSREANYQTFYLSNMQPQRSVFNSGIWKEMEEIVNGTWNMDVFRDTLYLCKGGTIDNPEQVLLITDKGLLVPRYFYMAVLCKNAQGYKALGFWVEHLNEDHSRDNPIDYVVSIDKLESLTGIDFFCNLPDDVEETVEKTTYPASWQLK